MSNGETMRQVADPGDRVEVSFTDGRRWTGTVEDCWPVGDGTEFAITVDKARDGWKKNPETPFSGAVVVSSRFVESLYNLDE